ncbi:MAG: hypothetical protein BWY68_00500 [bacterium ADurb.Bin400]|nr:MAG: hypothetical protein BWY68_00500 [bacterium ADurb.Bin400]
MDRLPLPAVYLAQEIRPCRSYPHLIEPLSQEVALYPVLKELNEQGYETLYLLNPGPRERQFTHVIKDNNGKHYAAILEYEDYWPH